MSSIKCEKNCERCSSWFPWAQSYVFKFFCAKKTKYIQFMIKYDKKMQQILTFETLEPDSFWHFACKMINWMKTVIIVCQSANQLIHLLFQLWCNYSYIEDCLQISFNTNAHTVCLHAVMHSDKINKYKVKLQPACPAHIFYSSVIVIARINKLKVGFFIFIFKLFTFISRLFFLPCRGPVSPHTSMETRLMSLLELWDSCHTTAAYKKSCAKRTNKQTMNRAEFYTSTVSAAEDEEEEEQKKTLPEKKKQNSRLKYIKKKNATTSILCLHRVFWCSICQVLLKCHMQILWCTLKMTDCVTNFRKYSIRPWKYIIFDNGCYYYRRYNIVIVILSWTVCVCVFVVFVLNYWVI